MNHLKNGTVAVGAPGSEMRRKAEIEDDLRGQGPHLFEGDCLQVMKDIPSRSVDLILCDLPYGTTACKWDTIIPFEPLWAAYWRLVKEDKSAVVLFGSEPFSTKLRMSAFEAFRYDWIWQKDKAGNFASSRFCPQKTHEVVSVFGR